MSNVTQQFSRIDRCLGHRVLLKRFAPIPLVLCVLLLLVSALINVFEVQSLEGVSNVLGVIALAGLGIVLTLWLTYLVIALSCIAGAVFIVVTSGLPSPWSWCVAALLLPIAVVTFYRAAYWNGGTPKDSS